MRQAAMRALVMLVAVTAFSSRAVAQGTPARPLPPERRICDMSFRIVAVRLVSRAGTPVAGAMIQVRRVRTRTMLEHAEAMGGQGDYRILEDGALADLRPGGEPFDVTFTKAGRSRRVRLIIGMDPGGCHVMLKGGSSKVVF